MRSPSWCHPAVLVLTALSLLACGGAAPPATTVGNEAAPGREREVRRVRAHLERVERELRASTPPSLSADQLAARERILKALHDYVIAEQYPTNERSAELVPIFVDAHGARCAMAYLLEQTGHRSLVARVARDQNGAYIEDLKDDPELREWLDENGLGLVEAARIQPDYSPAQDTWSPTVMAFGSAQLGSSTWLAPAIRAGVRLRHWVEDGDACDECVDRSWALLAEYVRAFSVNAAATNLVSVLLQRQLDGHYANGQLHLIGGPMLSLGDDRSPGVVGYGAQLGVGYALRRPISWVIHPFLELTGSVLRVSTGWSLHTGLNLGMVW